MLLHVPWMLVHVTNLLVLVLVIIPIRHFFTTLLHLVGIHSTHYLRSIIAHTNRKHVTLIRLITILINKWIHSLLCRSLPIFLVLRITIIRPLNSTLAWTYHSSVFVNHVLIWQHLLVVVRYLSLVSTG